MRFLFFGTLLFVAGAILVLMAQWSSSAYAMQQRRIASGALIPTYGTIARQSASTVPGGAQDSVQFVTTSGNVIQAQPIIACASAVNTNQLTVAIAYNPRNPYYVEEQCDNSNTNWLNGAGGACLGAGLLIVLIEVLSHLPLFRSLQTDDHKD